MTLKRRERVRDLALLKRNMVPALRGSFVAAGITFDVVTARYTGHDSTCNELLGNHIYRSAYTKNYVNTMLLEELHCTGPHPTSNYVGHLVRSKEWRQDARLVSGNFQFFSLINDTVFN
jgi:hypothetical protein